METVGFFLNLPDSGALSPLADKEWVKTAATRLSMRDAQEAFEASERIGASILIPGDPESPTQLRNLQERAPFATVFFTVSSGEEAAEFTARRAKNLAEQDRLLDAHLAEAISVEHFKARQDKLRAECDTLPEFAEHDRGPVADDDLAASTSER